MDGLDWTRAPRSSKFSTRIENQLNGQGEHVQTKLELLGNATKRRNQNPRADGSPPHSPPPLTSLTEERWLQRRHMTALHYNRPNTKAQKGDINNEGFIIIPAEPRIRTTNGPTSRDPPAKAAAKGPKGGNKKLARNSLRKFCAGDLGFIFSARAAHNESHLPNHTRATRQGMACKSEERAPHEKSEARHPRSEDPRAGAESESSPRRRINWSGGGGGGGGDEASASRAVAGTSRLRGKERRRR